jgi:hypothetical protein
LNRAFWITWYDLPAEGRDEYLAWLHGVYIPEVLARPGIMWGAHYTSEENVVPLGGGAGRVRHHAALNTVPNGDRFILMFGATDAHVLVNPAPREFNAALPLADQKMLAMRMGERVNIMLEEGTIYGPDAGAVAGSAAPGPCIQLGSFNAGASDDEFELATWYARWRLASLKTLPGVIRVRKLVSVAGWAKHACFYEFTSVAARNEHFVHYEQSNPAMETWSKNVVRTLVHAPKSPNLARRIWPPVA